MRLAPALLAGLAALALPSAPAFTRPPTAADLAKEVADQARLAEEQALAADEQALVKVGQGVDGPALLDYFRKRTFPETNPQVVASLVRQLGDDRFAVREKAQAGLLALGPGALFALRKAEADPDGETRRRVHDLRLLIEEKADPAVQAATARLIGARRPAGAAAVLLAYLPFAADEGVVDEICTALGKVAAPGGKADPAVVAALADKSPLKRGAAGQALAAAGAELPAARKLLQDPDAKVRLRVALALVRGEDREAARAAVPALIATLGDLPPERLWPAEEALTMLAGDAAPRVSLGTDEATRKAARAAWEGWWAKSGAKIDLARLHHAEPQLGFTLIVQQGMARFQPGGFARISGEVLELDSRKKVRWRIEADGYPVDARVVGPDRVLVTEFNGRRVSERDTKGKVHWQHQVINGMPISAQRLPNGDTFIVTQNRLAEVDKAGKEVWNYDRNVHDLLRGHKLRNGDVIFVTNSGILTRLDGRTKREIKSFPVGPVGHLFGSIDVLPGGNVLVPLMNANRVVEFDPNGREVWQVAVPSPNSAQRLPNGHVLVSSVNTRQVVELDRSGREVWSYAIDGQMVFLARRR